MSISRAIGFIMLCLPLLTGCKNVGNEKRIPEQAEVISVTQGLKEIDVTVFCKTYNKLEVPVEKGVANLSCFIAERFSPPFNERVIRFGKYPEAQVGWVYLKIVNTLLEDSTFYIRTKYRRSDGIKGYLLTKRSIKNIGEVYRQTPVHERAYPNYDLALSFTVQPKDTVGILIRSERYVNLHNLGLFLSSKKYYESSARLRQFFEIGNAFAFALIICLILIYTVRFKDKFLGTLALFGTAILLLSLSYEGYFDTLPFPEGIGLSHSNPSGFLILLCNMCFHCWIYFLIVKYRSGRRLCSKAYCIVLISLLSLNLVTVSCYFLPNAFFVSLDLYVMYLSSILTVFNIIWACYNAYLHYRISGRTWFITTVVLTLLPAALRLVFEFLKIELFPSYENITYLTVFILVFAFAYVVVLHLQDKLILKSESEQRLLQVSKSLHEVNTSEIKKIGRNLHDQVGNTLASALGYLNMKQPKTTEVRNLLELAIQDLRLVSHNIIKHDPDKFSAKSIESLVDRMNDFSTINFHFNDYSNGTLSRLNFVEKQNIYNIVQELLTNIYRHSEATDAFVELFNDNRKIRVSIEDNGVGFDVSENHGGIGLQNIKFRADILNFTYVIDSTTRGTTILLEVNYDK